MTKGTVTDMAVISARVLAAGVGVDVDVFLGAFGKLTESEHTATSEQKHNAAISKCKTLLPGSDLVHYLASDDRRDGSA